MFPMKKIENTLIKVSIQVMKIELLNKTDGFYANFLTTHTHSIAITQTYIFQTRSFGFKNNLKKRFLNSVVIKLK